MLFDSFTVSVVALLAGLIGYVIGALRASVRAPTPLPMRRLSRRERDDVVALLADGDTTGAIRLLRELTGADLASAHEAIERIRDDLNPRIGSGARDRAV